MCSPRLIVRAGIRSSTCTPRFGRSTQRAPEAAVGDQGREFRGAPRTARPVQFSPRGPLRALAAPARGARPQHRTSPFLWFCLRPGANRGPRIGHARFARCVRTLSSHPPWEGPVDQDVIRVAPVRHPVLEAGAAGHPCWNRHRPRSSGADAALVRDRAPDQIGHAMTHSPNCGATAEKLLPAFAPEPPTAPGPVGEDANRDALPLLRCEQVQKPPSHALRPEDILLQMDTVPGGVTPLEHLLSRRSRRLRKQSHFGSWGLQREDRLRRRRIVDIRCERITCASVQAPGLAPRPPRFAKTPSVAVSGTGLIERFSFSQDHALVGGAEGEVGRDGIARPVRTPWREPVADPCQSSGMSRSSDSRRDSARSRTASLPSPPR